MIICGALVAPAATVMPVLRIGVITSMPSTLRTWTVYLNVKD